MRGHEKLDYIKTELSKKQRAEVILEREEAVNSSKLLCTRNQLIIKIIIVIREK